MRQNLDLFGDVLDTLIKTPPIPAEIFYDPDHARGQHVAAFSQDVWKLLAEEAKPLSYRNAMLQEKAADLIDHSRSLADQARSHPAQRL
jgi:hypothetical protein